MQIRKIKRKNILYLALICFAILIAGCQKNKTEGEIFEATATNTPVPTATSIPVPTATNTPVPTATSTPNPTSIPVPTPIVVPGEEWKLNLGTIDLDKMKVTGDGISVQGTTIKIIKGGDFTVTGTLKNGKIVISTTERAKLRLAGASITCENDSAIFVEQADKAFITIEDGTVNKITSRNTEEAAIYSKDDLEIKGKGTLSIYSELGHGIKASDDLNIENGTMMIEAARDGIHINSTCDISGGTITITCGNDGVDCEENIIIRGGSLIITAMDKAITALGDVTIEEEKTNINILGATEGIESKQTLTVNNGIIQIVCSDDGFNTGADVVYTEEEIKIPASKRPNTLIINGGDITIHAEDDCMDSNAAMLLTGGIIKIGRSKGEVMDAGNAAITVQKGVRMIYAVESKFAEENFNNEQNSVVFSGKAQKAGTLVTLCRENGTVLGQFAPNCRFQAIIFSVPELVIGETYRLTVGQRNYEFVLSSHFTSIDENFYVGASGQNASSLGQGETGFLNLTEHVFLTSDGSEINYLLFTPKQTEENMPLVVYLHGGSGKGNDLSILVENGFCQWVNAGEFNDFPAYILFPQLSSEFRGWSNAASNVIQLIDTVVMQYQLASDNVSLTGHSMGGTGTFSLASEYPEHFVRVAPASGSITLYKNTPAIFKDLPVWAVVGSADTVVSPDSSVNFVEAVKKSGCTAYLTVLDGATHTDVPELMYREDALGILKWLIGN